MFSLDTPRLLLRDVQDSDAGPFLALFTTPEVTCFQTFVQVRDEAQAADWLRQAGLYNRQQPRRAYNLALVRKSDAAWLGWFGMGYASDRTLGDLDFGYALHPAFWGQGYMSEALRALVDFSFRELGIQSLYGECERENPGSARVMQKAGLRLCDTFTETDEHSGRVKNMQRYRITRAQWQPPSPNPARL